MRGLRSSSASYVTATFTTCTFVIFPDRLDKAPFPNALSLHIISLLEERRPGFALHSPQPGPSRCVVGRRIISWIGAKSSRTRILSRSTCQSAPNGSTDVYRPASHYPKLWLAEGKVQPPMDSMSTRSRGRTATVGALKKGCEGMVGLSSPPRPISSWQERQHAASERGKHEAALASCGVP
ncbi:hypothetical protein BKA70DRAFT_1295129 [Coprinopsis sp. MPI-PUGE-AT-0042]|nr:hypothetical protein BKA70DRAFT_1295129 [Coprinopsis sp. MPI-PUGE-AT-0042]